MPKNMCKISVKWPVAKSCDQGQTNLTLKVSTSDTFVGHKIRS